MNVVESGDSRPAASSDGSDSLPEPAPAPPSGCALPSQPYASRRGFVRRPGCQCGFKTAGWKPRRKCASWRREACHSHLHQADWGSSAYVHGGALRRQCTCSGHQQCPRSPSGMTAVQPTRRVFTSCGVIQHMQKQRPRTGACQFRRSGGRGSEWSRQVSKCRSKQLLMRESSPPTRTKAESLQLPTQGERQKRGLLRLHLRLRIERPQM
jgi:hypothetical protein